VYKDAFDQSDPIAKRRILSSYSANFPHLAFDRDSSGAWLWPLLQEWRERYSREDRRLLRALAKGITARGSGGMSKRRARAWAVAQAKTSLANLKKNNTMNLEKPYGRYLENADSPHDDLRRRSETEDLQPLIRTIKKLTGHQTSAAELKRMKLAGVLRRAVSKNFGVRERDLH
jgi:hypothetical protein